MAFNRRTHKRNDVTGEIEPIGKSTELTDLKVERVDGVDRPATGRKFVLFKSAGQLSELAKSQIREWNGDLTEAQIDAIARRLMSMTADPTDATARPAYARDSFLHGEMGESVRPLQDYKRGDPWLSAGADEPGFSRARESSGLPGASSFVAPVPGAVRLGDGYQFSISKSELQNIAAETDDPALRRAIEKKIGKSEDADWASLNGPSRWRKKSGR
jgi:hypothetical protein